MVKIEDYMFTEIQSHYPFQFSHNTHQKDKGHKLKDCHLKTHKRCPHMEKILFDLPDALLTDSSIWDLSNKKNWS